MTDPASEDPPAGASPANATASATDPKTSPSRLKPWEWLLLGAMAAVLAAVLVPRLSAERARRNERAMFFRCHTLSRAQREVEKLATIVPALDGRVRYATPRVLAGAEPYLPGQHPFGYLDASWLTLGPGGEADAPCGYRVGFFLAESRDRWALVAWPRRWGDDGEAVFAVTQAGDIRRWSPATPPTTGAVTPWTKDELAAAAWGSAGAAVTEANDTWRPGWEAARY